jgi:hypothetical protein
MWEPRPLTPLWAFTACYRDRFTLYLKHMYRHTLSILILLLAALLLPWNFGTQVKSIPIPIFSRIHSARTTHRKHGPSIVARRRPHRKHVSRVRVRVHWSVSSSGRGADDIENTASSIVACWTVITALLPLNALIKSVTICIGMISSI